MVVIEKTFLRQWAAAWIPHFKIHAQPHNTTYWNTHKWVLLIEWSNTKPNDLVQYMWCLRWRAPLEPWGPHGDPHSRVNSKMNDSGWNKQEHVLFFFFFLTWSGLKPDWAWSWSTSVIDWLYKFEGIPRNRAAVKTTFVKNLNQLQRHVLFHGKTTTLLLHI